MPTSTARPAPRHQAWRSPTWAAPSGKKIEVLVADHQNKPDVAASKAREWFDTAGPGHADRRHQLRHQPGDGQGGAEKKKPFLAVGAGTSALTNEQCSPYTVHYAYDTVALAKGTGNAGRQGRRQELVLS
jgi:branched-chain amino acid transport system substrate-binding protein